MIHPFEICMTSRQRVSALVTAMAGMTESAVDQAIQALLEGNISLAHDVLQKENAIKHMEMHLDTAVLECLSHRGLLGDELRSIACVLTINKDLGRIGQLTAETARKVIELRENLRGPARFDLQPMAIAVSHVCRKALRAVVRQDPVLAESALHSEEAVRKYGNYVFHCMQKRLVTGGSQSNSDTALLAASRSLEQIAERATCLANNLISWRRNKARHARLAG
jgi:phosphate transport system protein